MTTKKTLTNAFKKYSAVKKSKLDLKNIFSKIMPEIIFRTTKLEGEKVTRKMVNNIFR